MKLKLVAEEYTYTQKERSWGSCQENDNSPEAYYDVKKTGYRIRRGETIIADGFYSLDRAKQTLTFYKRSAKTIKKLKMELINDTKKALKNLEKAAAKEIDLWEAKQLKRAKMISKDQYLGTEYTNLSHVLNLNEKIVSMLDDHVSTGK